MPYDVYIVHAVTYSTCARGFTLFCFAVGIIPLLLQSIQVTGFRLTKSIKYEGLKRKGHCAYCNDF